MTEMRFFLMFLIIITGSCSNKNSHSFRELSITIFDLSTVEDSVKFQQWQEANVPDQISPVTDTLFSKDTIPIGSLFYSDDRFSVYGDCMGEFGGSLIFQDKENEDAAYYLECTCPVMIDRRDDGYYVIESLTHGTGAGRVLYFESPKQLVQLHVDSLAGDWKTLKYPDLNEYVIRNKLRNQGTVLLDTIGITISTLFPYKNENLLIFSDQSHTYLGSLKHGNLEVVDTILSVPTWRHNWSPDKNVHGFYHYSFVNRSVHNYVKAIQETKNTGEIYVKDNMIVIAYTQDQRN